MRQIILSLIGICIIVAGYLGMKHLSSSEKKEKPVFDEKIAQVFVQPISPQSIEVDVKLTGRLEALNKIPLFSETQGSFFSSKSFRPGTFFKKGALIIGVDNTQEYSALKAQRSTLLNQIVTILPDIKFEYPESFSNWESYVKNFDFDRTTPELPTPQSDQEKFFILGKNLQTTFYNIKTQEARLAKYRIYAPFSGVLSETNVVSGARISPGQNLGTFTSQSSFELVLPVREEYLSRVKVGQTLNLSSTESSETHSGKVTRINPTINPSTQTSDVFIKVSGTGLREGMFFEARLPLEPFQDAMLIDRKLLINNSSIWALQDSTLFSLNVKPVHYNEETVVVKGLPEKGFMLSKSLPGARENMNVEVITE